ncbi:MAG TPA: glycosyltransferase [Actinomycetes bacterium]|nr:glycosyltransferase [Actinomycetes bacterium]
MRVLVFGTYDAARHPRIAVLTEGLRRHGAEIAECNVPLGLDTADRVAILRQPWRLPVLAGRIGRSWRALARRARRLPAPDLVLVGYLGHFDVHLARRLFPATPIVLDHLIGAADTAKDRGVYGGTTARLLQRLDRAALRAADVVVVDTDEHLAILPEEYRTKAVAVAVGAAQPWFDAGRRAAVGEPGIAVGAPETAAEPLRVVFFGLYTPLQGAPVIGAALRELAGLPIQVTMIGTGQDLAATRAAAGAGTDIRWLDWAAATELPALVAGHDVCLGIFGTGPKASRVVPNKVFQGAAAGCAIVTSDTPPQRRALGDAAVLVPPGDSSALANALRALAADPALTAAYRRAAVELAASRFSADAVIAPLLDRLATAEVSPR